MTLGWDGMKWESLPYALRPVEGQMAVGMGVRGNRQTNSRNPQKGGNSENSVQSFQSRISRQKAHDQNAKVTKSHMQHHLMRLTLKHIPKSLT